MDVPGGVPVAHPAADGHQPWTSYTTTAVPLAEIDDVRADWHERPEVVRGDATPLFFFSFFLAELVGLTAISLYLLVPLVIEEADDWALRGVFGLFVSIMVLGASGLYYCYHRAVAVSSTRGHALPCNTLSTDDAAVRIGNALNDDRAALHVVMACYHTHPRGVPALGLTDNTVSWTGRQPLQGLTAVAGHPSTALEEVLPQVGGAPGGTAAAAAKPVRLFLYARGVLSAAAAEVVASQVDAFVAAHRHRDRHHAVAVQLVMPPGWGPRLTVTPPGPGAAPLLARPAAWAVASAVGLAWAYELACRSAMDSRQLTLCRSFVVTPKGGHVD